MKELKAALYVRVSTTDQGQSVQMQTRELQEYAKRRGWHVFKVYEDEGVSGAKVSRPGLDDLMADCRRRRVDVVLVWKFDRFSRSVRQLVTALDTFRELGIHFASCTEALDTSLPHGETMFQIIAAFAQLERRLIGERVRAGIEHARKAGKRLGRPPLRQLSRNDIASLRKERRQHRRPYRDLAKRWGVSVFTAHTLCNARG